MREKYSEDVGKYEILTAEQEHELAVKMRSGDKNAREMLINSNLRFVISVAKRYANDDNLEDLVQAGNVGLIEGVDRYNPDLGFRVTTYVKCRILKEILDYYKKNGMIKLSGEQKKLIKETDRIIQKMFARNGETPDPEEIAKILGSDFSGNDVKDAIQADKNTKTISLNQHIGDENSPELLDSLGTDRRDELINEMHGKATVELVRAEILTLNTRDDIKKMLMGVLFEGKSLDEISQEMGTKKETIKQRYNMGIRKLRMALSKTKHFK